MEAVLARGVRETIDRAARAALPDEACGLLVGARAGARLLVRQATVARNVDPEPRCRFEIDPAHLLAHQRAARACGAAILGLWHTHPQGPPAPSARDRDGVTDREWLWLVWAGGHLAAFRPDAAEPSGFQPVPLLDGATASW